MHKIASKATKLIVKFDGVNWASLSQVLFGSICKDVIFWFIKGPHFNTPPFMKFEGHQLWGFLTLPQA